VGAEGEADRAAAPPEAAEEPVVPAPPAREVVVGYALTTKKAKSFLQPKLRGLARYCARGGSRAPRLRLWFGFGLGRDGSVRKRCAAPRLGYFGGFGTGWRRRALGAGVWWRGGP
jgi:hypothetical protein